jgi:hypothetical protein
MTRFSVVLAHLVLAVAWMVVPVQATDELVVWPESVVGSGFVPV